MHAHAAASEEKVSQSAAAHSTLQLKPVGHSFTWCFGKSLALSNAQSLPAHLCLAAKHCLALGQVTLEMEGGVRTAFCDPRRFGRVKQAADVAAELAHLGFDPILSMPALEQFTQMLSKERRGIKALLLDQVRHESMHLMAKSRLSKSACFRFRSMPMPSRIVLRVSGMEE